MWHFQGTTQNWPDVVPDTICIKAIDRGDILKTAKLIKPSVFTILRHHFAGFQYGGTWDENVARARAFFPTFIDETFDRDFAPYVDAIEGGNEYLANSQTPEEVEAILLFDRALAYVWKFEYRTQPKYAHIQLVICNTAVGNWIDYRFGELAMEYDCLLGYHPYTLYEDGERWAGDFDNLSGLFAVMEDEWPDHVKPQWVFTECGPFRTVSDGWRHPSVLNGDINAYVAAVRAWVEDVKGTPAYQEGRIKGFNLFNSGGTDKWVWYETNTENMLALAPMIKSLWVPMPVPPPEPPPPNPTPYDPVPFSQRDPRWKDELLGYSTTYTIGSAGCALTCSAMVAAVVNDEVDPSTLNERMQNIGGFSGALIIWDKLEEAVEGVQWGGATRWYDIPADLDVLAAELGQFPTIVLVDFYPGGDLNTHFVLATGFTDDGQDLYIIDPWDGAKTQLLLRYGGQSGWDLQRALYGMYRVRAIDVTPPVDPCWCWPRVQYSRLVWVPYVAAANSTVIDIYKTAAEAGITCAMSVDDAGASGCEVNKLVLWNFPLDVQGLYRAFFAEHYPHAEVEFRRWVSVDFWTRVKGKLGL